MRKVLSAIVIAAMFAAACGKSEEQKQAEKAAEDLTKAAEAFGQAAAKAGSAGATAGADDAAKAMQAMAAAMGGKTADGKPVEAVAFQTLYTGFPEVSGWKMDKPRGEKMTVPMAFSAAKANYRNGEQHIELEIGDSAQAAMMLGPLRMLVASGYSRESSEGYEKATTFEGHPAAEKWNADRKRGEFTILVADRFVVVVRGRKVNDVETMRDFAGEIDLGKIAAMK